MRITSIEYYSPVHTKLYRLSCLEVSNTSECEFLNKTTSNFLFKLLNNTKVIENNWISRIAECNESGEKENERPRRRNSN